MAYLRPSTKLIDNCKFCDNSGYKIITESEHDGVFTSIKSMQFTIRSMMWKTLCRNCTSCWYIYVSDQLVIDHGGDCSLTDFRISLTDDEAKKWRPPGDCKFAEHALRAVREYLAKVEMMCDIDDELIPIDNRVPNNAPSFQWGFVTKFGIGYYVEENTDG